VPDAGLANFPFLLQVTETGYAGFTIPINISFKGVQKKYTINYDMNLTYGTNGRSGMGGGENGALNLLPF
jgi:transcription initiation factor IIF auxiliary subunit